MRIKRLNAWTQPEVGEPLGNYVMRSLLQLRQLKKDLKDKLANNLKSGNISGKGYWRTFKFSHRQGKQTVPIPPLNHNGKQINDPAEKANV